VRKGVVGDDHVRPSFTDKFVLADQFARPLAKHFKHPEGLGPQESLRARPVLQTTAGTVQNEIAETHGALIVQANLNREQGPLVAQFQPFFREVS
jgi:hypothetical protein